MTVYNAPDGCDGEDPRDVDHSCPVCETGTLEGDRFEGSCDTCDYSYSNIREND